MNHVLEMLLYLFARQPDVHHLLDSVLLRFGSSRISRRQSFLAAFWAGVVFTVANVPVKASLLRVGVISYLSDVIDDVDVVVDDLTRLWVNAS